MRLLVEATEGERRGIRDLGTALIGTEGLRQLELDQYAVAADCVLGTALIGTEGLRHYARATDNAEPRTYS